MAGALPHYRQGPATYQAAGLILGGQLVTNNSNTAGDVTIKVQPTASAGTALTVLGVAGSDANALTEPIFPGSAVDPTGTQDTLLDLGFVKSEVAVYNNVDIVVNYDGAVNFGQLLMASTSVAGAVTAFTGSVYSAVIGRCSQPGGVAAAGTGRAFIRV
jgi:hypothetical protein